MSHDHRDVIILCPSHHQESRKLFYAAGFYSVSMGNVESRILHFIFANMYVKALKISAKQ